MSIVQISSTLRKPLLCIVGVHRTSLSLMRTVMFPSLAAANPLLYSRRPISQMSCLILCALVLMVSVSLFSLSVSGV